MITFRIPSTHLLVSLCLVLLTSCTSQKDTSLTGSWKLDSIFYFDNGFTYTNKAPYPAEVHVYKEDSTFLRRGMGRENSFVFSLRNNELFIRDTSNGSIAKFTILSSNKKTLTIRKEKSAIFAGKNQERYEIRFFTRLVKDSIN